MNFMSEKSESHSQSHLEICFESHLESHLDSHLQSLLESHLDSHLQSLLESHLESHSDISNLVSELDESEDHHSTSF